MKGKKKPPTLCESVGGDSSRKRRSITHTFIIIPLSGAMCKSEKASVSRFYGLVWDINKPTRTESRRRVSHEDYIQRETVLLR